MFLATCRGLPWTPRPRATTMPAPLEGGPTVGPPGGTAVPPAGDAPRVRKLYVLKADIDKYGGSNDCPACTEMAAGGKRISTHSEECRMRITELMARETEDPVVQLRFQRHQERHQEVPAEEPAAPERTEGQEPPEEKMGET